MDKLNEFIRLVFIFIFIFLVFITGLKKNDDNPSGLFVAEGEEVHQEQTIALPEFIFVFGHV